MSSQWGCPLTDFEKKRKVVPGKKKERKRERKRWKEGGNEESDQMKT